MSSRGDQESGRQSVSGKRWTLAAVRSGLRLVGRLSPRLAGRLVFSLMIRPARREVDLSETNSNLEAVRISHGERKLQAYSWNGDQRALLVHGWGGSAVDFSALIPRLARAGWGGFAYDGPAHGRSDGSTTDFLELGGAFCHVLRVYGPFDVVVSHSLGAAVALYQLAHADLSTPRFIIAGGAPAWLPQVFSYYAGKLGLAPDVWENLNHRITRRLGQPAEAFSMAESVQHLDSDLLLVHDHDDKYFHIEAAHQLQEAANDATLIETTGLGHRGWLEDERVFLTVLDFLNEKELAKLPAGSTVIG